MKTKTTIRLLATALAEELKTLQSAACIYAERHGIQCGIYGGQIIQEAS